MRPVFCNNSRREETERFASLMVGLRFWRVRVMRSGQRDPKVVGGETRQDRQTRRSRLPGTYGRAGPSVKEAVRRSPSSFLRQHVS